MKKRAPLKEQSLAILQSRNVPVAAVLDVGVLTSTRELIRAYPDVPHVLFEPVAEFAEAIARNYRNIKHELVQAAVGDSSGTTQLNVLRKVTGADISHSGMVTENSPASQEVRSVPKISLDDYLRDKTLPEPFLLKIDIDGHEMQVIEGARETLPRCSVVIIECAGHSLPDRIGAIQNAGFRLFDLSEPCYYDNAFWQCDAIFIRNDIHAEKFKRIGGKVEIGLYHTFRG